MATIDLLEETANYLSTLLCAGLRRGTAGKISVYSGSPQRGACGVQALGLRGAFVPRAHAGGALVNEHEAVRHGCSSTRAFCCWCCAFVPAKAGKPCRQRRRGAGHRGRGAGRAAKDEPAPQAGSANAGKAHAHPAPVQSGAAGGTALRLDSRIEVFPTVLLALPDADLADAAAESARTRTELGLYERRRAQTWKQGEGEV